jgi:hypothetical protein
MMRRDAALACMAGAAIAAAPAPFLPAMDAHANLAGVSSLRASAPGDDETFRAIRAAEMSADRAQLGAWTGEDRAQRVRARAALAAEAVRLRGEARTIAEAVAAEREIERLRGALIDKLAADAPLAARELALESAEDLLLRLHAIPYGDASVAIALPSEAELAEMHALRALIESRLASPMVAPCLAADAGVATDAAVFRAHALKALSALLSADLALCEAEGIGRAPATIGERAAARSRAASARGEAQRLLARASLCELPIPPALGDVLALAGGRVEDDAARRERMLARAADSADPAVALVARTVRWRDAGGHGPFPSVGGDSAPFDALARIAAAAEVRARLGLGAGVDAVAAPIARSLQRAGAESADAGGSIRRRRATADWFADRLPTELRVAAAKDGSPAALVAVVALSAGTDGDPGSPDVARRVAFDPLVGPLVALRVAERLAAHGDTDAAADVIVEAVRRFDGLPSAREAMAIAIDLRRRRGEAASNAGARPLDAALALAIERFPADPASMDWRFERIDLALFGSAEIRDLPRAAELLRDVPKSAAAESDRNNVFLRQIELELMRLTEAAPPTTAAKRQELAAQVAELGKTATVFDIQSLGAVDPATSPSYVKALPSRMSAVRAAIASFTGDAVKACVLAERVFADELADDATSLRAAKTWVEAALATGEAVRVPRELRAFAARSPAFREWAAQPLSRIVDGAEQAIAAGTPSQDSPGAIDALATLVGAREVAPDAQGLRARAVGRLAALDRSGAERLAREALHLDAGDRLSQWILAEALRVRGDDDGRLEAFALYRTLSPIAAAERDRFWWRAQLAQLEMLVAQPGRGAAQADIVARVNRLAAIDSTLGGPPLAKRFEAVRARAIESGRAATGPADSGREPTD